MFARKLSRWKKRMQKTIDSPHYDELIIAIKNARKKANLTQQDLADHLGKPQSFIAKIENKERLLDIIEFLAVASAVGLDWMSCLSKAMHEMQAEN